MATVTVDTCVIEFAKDFKKIEAASLILLIYQKDVKIGVDIEGIIEKEYREHIRNSRALQRWWIHMENKRLIERYTVSKRGPYPPKNLSEADKMFLDVACMTDTKIFVSEDSDFYVDKTLDEPHPVVKERGINLMKIETATNVINVID